MMAERLAQMRAEYDSIEGKPNHTVGHIRELLDHIAQLEAQRGELVRELDLTKREAWTAKERHKDEKDRADGLRERLDELNADEFVKAQRGGAVVVPELTDIELSACERLARMCRKSPSLVEGYLDDIKPWEAAEAIEKAAAQKAIPADRVLADGMVGVDREYLRFLEDATTCSPWPNCKTCELGEKPCGCIAYEKGNGCSWWRINKTKRDALGAQTVEAK